MTFQALHYFSGGKQKQAPLPPFDPSDSYGLVHTIQPPDLVIPSTPTRDFFLGDIGGVMLPVAPPYVPGANTNFGGRMTMSFLLPHYVQFGTGQIDAFFAAHASRGYRTFHFDRWQADNAGLSDSQHLDLMAAAQSNGFFTSCWFSGSEDPRSGGWNTIGSRLTAFMDALLARPQSFLDQMIAMPGEELNNGCPPGPGGCDDIIANVCSRMNPVGIPVWLHFTSNYPGYPQNVPPDQADAAMVSWIAQWRGRVRGLAAQMDSYNPGAYPDPSAPNPYTLSSAGYMGAKLWDIRRFWARAGYTDYPSVAAFELMADAELYGRCSEPYGALRGLEMLYCTSDGSAPPVAGIGNGGWLPDGTPLS